MTFASFARRLTRGYVIVAIVLIVVVAGTSTALAFVLYAGGVNESLANASARASADAKARLKHATLARAAPSIVKDVARSRFRVAVYDDSHRRLASSEPPGSGDGRSVMAIASSIVGLRRARVPVPGGFIVIATNFDRFGRVLAWYWSIILPVGIVAAFLAWFIGRRTTAHAIGPLRDVTAALNAVASGGGSPERVLSGGRDLRDLTTAYNDVVYRLATQTAQREKAEAQMRQFIADAGHELRTPLTVIMGYLNLLRGGGLRDSSATDRAYDSMLEESRRMRALVEKLIFLARLDRPPAPERAGPVDLSAVVARAAASLATVADTRRLVPSADRNATFVTADENEVYESVKNVIDNALKYAPDSPVRIALSREDGRACAVISDDGPGMSEQDLAHAFDRFYRGSTRGDAEGSGLGLAIAKQGVERAGGTVSIESTPGRGTTVSLCFPASTLE